jgi:hypothetical protein
MRSGRLSLLCLGLAWICACAPPTGLSAPDVGSSGDAGAIETDAGPDDSGPMDAAFTDSGPAIDAGPRFDAGDDAGQVDLDAGPEDSGPPAGRPDAGPRVDAGPPTGPVSAGVAKVKNLLVGLPPTESELAAVRADSGALEPLIEQWMATPEYDEKMLRFLSTAFQQSGINWDELKPQFGGLGLPPFSQSSGRTAPFLQNLAESFGRTAQQLVAENRSFTSTLTTRRFMMTPALMATYALIDALPLPDGVVGVVPQQPATQHDVTIESDTPIPFEESVDPNSPNFMRFYNPSIAHPSFPNCPSHEIVFHGPIGADLLVSILLSSDFAPFDYDPATHTVLYNLPHPTNWISCRLPAPPAANAYLKDSDFTSWRMITIRAPRPGEATTSFYALPSLRTADELVLNVPRVGFFSTLSFFGQWSTNTSNQARVTINQTLIVSLGQPVDLSNPTTALSLAALDRTHAAPGTACYDCHRALDPMRQYFRQAYTLNYSVQKDTQQANLPGQFAFHDVAGSGRNIFDLGQKLANHPLFAAAWVQKLCTYANSAPCDDSDPEFMRIVSLFTASRFAWPVLVQELFSSPLVTGLTTAGSSTPAPETFPIARQAHLCALLSNRLGLPDACGLNATTVVPTDLQAVHTVAATWPSDQYGRGNPTAVLANTPSLFTRTGLERLCSALADHTVDTPGGRFLSARVTDAEQSLVTDLMGLNQDRAQAALVILQDHYTHARSTGASSTEALKSTFILACLSPWVAGVGL